HPPREQAGGGKAPLAVGARDDLREEGRRVLRAALRVGGGRGGGDARQVPAREGAGREGRRAEAVRGGGRRRKVHAGDREGRRRDGRRREPGREGAQVGALRLHRRRGDQPLQRGRAAGV